MKKAWHAQILYRRLLLLCYHFFTAPNRNSIAFSYPELTSTKLQCTINKGSAAATERADNSFWGLLKLMNQRRPQISIAIEGLDGSGKTSLVKLLRENFSLQNKTSYVCEWFRGNYAKQTAMTHNLSETMSPEVLAALHALSTIYTLSAAEDSGADIIIWDRYIYSSYASCIIRGASTDLMKAHVSNIPQPKLVVLLLEESEICYERIMTRGGLRFFEANLDRLYRGRVKQGLDLFEKGHISKNLIKEVFIHSGKEWYNEIEKVLPDDTVKFYNLDIANASKVVEEITERLLT